MSRIRLVCFTLVIMAGCALGPGSQVETAQIQTVYTQSPSVVYAQPAPIVVHRPAPVIVHRPAQVVYRTAPVVYRPSPVIYRAPSNVMTPVRVSVPAQVYSNQVYSNQMGRYCVPGTSRTCDAYCGHGVQFCDASGMSWGSCIEQY